MKEMEEALKDSKKAAETAAVQLREKEKKERLLKEIANAANAADSIDDALQTTLDKVCAYMQWPIGHVYLPRPSPVSATSRIRSENAKASKSVASASYTATSGAAIGILVSPPVVVRFHSNTSRSGS